MLPLPTGLRHGIAADSRKRFRGVFDITPDKLRGRALKDV
jgi:hypothetical protein